MEVYFPAMKTRLFMPVAICLAIVAGILLPALTPDAGAGALKPVSIRKNGILLKMKSPPLLIDSTTYVPFFDFCKAMGPAATTPDANLPTVVTPELLITAAAGDCYITANKRYLYTPVQCKMIGNVLYVPLRPLAKAYGAMLAWSARSNTVYMLPAFGPIEHGVAFYDDTDIYWMSRIICAEARGECLSGKVAVGNVVMNRLRSPGFPNSVHGVIFDRRCAVQFTPAYSGAINCTPDPECVIAAMLALDGADVVGDSLYFNNARCGSWAARNRPLVTTIGNHSFFS